MQASEGTPRVVCVGALVIDLTFWAPRRPLPGETLLGTRFEEFLGGKGFNQAVAAARQGAATAMVGAVGPDGYGDRFVAALDAEGIDARSIHRVPDGTGVGQPLVTEDGEVAILGIPRANAALSAALVDEAAEVIAAADLLLLQCEVPLDASARAAAIARDAGTTVVLNTAPARPEVASLLTQADIIICNELEAQTLVGDASAPAEELHRRTGRPVIVTLGAAGARAIAAGEVHEVAAHRVPTVDPTGAGDAFCGAFAASIARGDALAVALRRGNAAGALAVQVAGAEPSMPRTAAVDDLLARAADDARLTAGEGVG